MPLHFQVCFFSSQVLVQQSCAGQQCGRRHGNYFDAISSVRALLCLHYHELQTSVGQIGDGEVLDIA